MTQRIQLTPHFWLDEFLFSETATRMGMEIVPTPEQRRNIERLCVEALEPIRALMGLPMVVSSGLRPEWLNDMVGGAANSAHLRGLAADVRVVGKSPAEVVQWIRDSGFKCDQVINEWNRWTHIAIGDGPPRGQYLIASTVRGQTHYEVIA